MGNTREYPPASWLDPRVKVRNSPIEGKGLFTNAPIKNGEVVIIWGGTIMTDADIQAGKHRPRTPAEIGEGVYIAGLASDPDEDPDENLNHSCDPNLWLQDEITLVARRDITKDEELTADYGTWVSRLYWKMECRCGSKLCRHLITGNNWKLKELQERYQDHFSPYLEERIKKLDQ